MNEIKSILEVIRRMKTTVILILFVVFVLFYYKPLITEVVETKVKKEKDVIKEDINNDVLIQQLLNELLLKYKGDRVYIFRFHNTIKYFDNKHRNHQSLTHEVCGRGISSEASDLQNLPTSLFPVFLQEVMLCKMVYSDIEDIKETATKIALRNQGIKSLIVAPVFRQGKFVAYIGIDYVKEKNDLKFSFEDFKKHASEIGAILTQ
jgi:hypothetical protein